MIRASIPNDGPEPVYDQIKAVQDAKGEWVAFNGCRARWLPNGCIEVEPVSQGEVTLEGKSTPWAWVEMVSEGEEE